MLEWQGERASVMEVSHRGKAFVDCAAQAEADMRELMGISDDYAVLFLQGGATTVSALFPMNMARQDQVGEYLLTGHWSEKALENASASVTTHVVASDKQNGYRSIPDVSQWQRASNSAYFHYTSNETIHGTQIKNFPASPIPVICDMSSDIFSRPVDVSKFDIIYAGAQKNMGPSGVTLVIIKKDIVGKHGKTLPTMLDYKTHLDNDSMYNTPPVFPILMCMYTMDLFSGITLIV